MLKPAQEYSPRDDTCVAAFVRRRAGQLGSCRPVGLALYGRSNRKSLESPDRSGAVKIGASHERHRQYFNDHEIMTMRRLQSRAGDLVPKRACTPNPVCAPASQTMASRTVQALYADSSLFAV
eukprot:6213525-Pleurochrysis_carterae.AAC.2